MSDTGYAPQTRAHASRTPAAPPCAMYTLYITEPTVAHQRPYRHPSNIPPLVSLTSDVFHLPSSLLSRAWSQSSLVPSPISRFTVTGTAPPPSQDRSQVAVSGFGFELRTADGSRVGGRARGQAPPASPEKAASPGKAASQTVVDARGAMDARCRVRRRLALAAACAPAEGRCEWLVFRWVNG
jgi:hypothetical protein